LGQVKSIKEFDYYLAVHKASGQFVKLDYGLFPPQRSRIEKTGPARPDLFDENKHALPEVGTNETKSTFNKTFINVGTFVTSN
jgi:hypothetical protein